MDIELVKIKKADVYSTEFVKEMTSNRLEIAKLLIDNGIDINAKDKRGMTALGYAKENGFSELSSLLNKFRAE